MKSSSLSIGPIARLLIIVSLLGAFTVPGTLGQVTFKGLPMVPLPGNFSYATVAGDFGRNGARDVAVLSTNAVNSLYILTNDGTGTLTLAHTYPTQQSGQGIATADLNGDGSLDLVVASVDPISQLWGYSVLLGNGDGSFQSPVFYPQNVFALLNPAIAIADFNHDGKPDLAITTGSGVAVLLGNGDGTFGSPAYFSPGVGPSIVSADFSGDGKLDIATGGSFGSGGLAILLGNGDGTFQPAVYSSTALFNGLLAADLNRDGKADLVTGTPAAQVYLGNGDGTFKAPSPIGQPLEGPFVTVLADINGDGKPDAIGGRQMSSQACDGGLFLGNGDGTFGSYILVLEQVFSSVFAHPRWKLSRPQT